MAQDHTLMASRYELKYIIPKHIALEMRDFVRQHLELDEFCAGRPDSSYPIHSLYLDSDDWGLYWDTINGNKNRYKLRVRYYTDDPKTPVFYEVKRRMKDVILKQRCGIKRGFEQLPLSGHLPERVHLASPNKATDLKAIHNFVELMLRRNAKAKMHVAYDREAYVNDYNNEFRVTFDRNVRVEPDPEARMTTKMKHPYDCTQGLVILELKFTNRFPDWYRDLLRAFHVPLMSASKYCEGSTLHFCRDLPEPDKVRNILL